MSSENVRNFFAQAKDDEALQASIRAIDHTSAETALSGLRKLADEAGYPFSGEEFTRAIRERVVVEYAAPADGASTRVAGETDVVTVCCDYCDTHCYECHWTDWPGCHED